MCEPCQGLPLAGFLSLEDCSLLWFASKVHLTHTSKISYNGSMGIENKIRVGIIRGGPSKEYDVSLKTGGVILKNLSESFYDTYDILIDKTGVWHIGGIPTKIARVADKIDVVVNALHGKYGEDGGVQKDLEQLNIPYTGSGVLSSSVAMNKKMAKDILKKAGVQTPSYVIIEARDYTNMKDGEEDILKEAISIFRSFPQPSIIKPIKGSSIGITLALDFNTFIDAIKNTIKETGSVMIEEYIKGREATCGVIEDFRGEDIYVLPSIEIIHSGEHPFFNYEAKYGGKTREECPSNFSKADKRQIAEISKKVHKELNLRHYSRSDFIISPTRGIYFLEVNTLPGLTQESLLPKSIQAVGSKLSDFLNHIIELAINKK